MKKILSSEIISLVHHVKLNESGWWEKTIQNIIISTFGINKNEPREVNNILDSIQNELQTDYDKSRILRQFDVLKSRKIIIPQQDNFFMLSKEAFVEFQNNFEEQKKIEIEAENRFYDSCCKLCPEMDSRKLWKELNELLIIPLIREIGAKTFELISGTESKTIEKYGQFVTFISRYSENKGLIQTLLLNYFDFNNEYVRKYVLHQLNAYFFIEATNLNQKTIDQVYNLSKSQTNLKIYVDTNFLLTLLDLHDNPSNDAAFTLLDLLNEIKNRVNVKFYVLPITVLEFQNLIKKFKDYLKRIKPTLSQAIAAESNDDFSGIIKKYFHKCHEQKSVLDVDDYFDPFLDNFTVNVRKKGLEIEQVKMEMYSTDQRVIDDLLEQVEYRFERNKSQGRYSGLSTFEVEERRELIYSKFNHDCQMWHYLKDKRPAYIDSTKDVTNWILTLDFSFLEFDKFKQYKDTNNKITLCLHPNEFISMLQFWVPRTEKFENAILGNFRLPFLFKEVDGESEKVSLEILRAMSQYEDGGTFSSELVTEMLTNKALRQKIKVQNSVEENALLIKDELFAKYEATKNLLSKEKEEKNSLSKELNFVRSELSSLNKKIDILQEETHKKIEKELGLVRDNQILELIKQKEAFAIKMTGLQDRLSDFEELIRNADLELERNLKTFSSFFNEIFKGKEKHKSQMKLTIHKKYYDTEKYEQIRNEILHLNNYLMSL